jgi:RNA polymerase sigma-70 factor (ECF subfamily)
MTGGDVRRMFERGRNAWPGLTVDEVVFAAHVRERVPADGDPSGIAAEDLYLACACAAGDEEALRAFERHHLCEVFDFLAGSRPDQAFVREVLQRLRIRLFVEGKIRQYSGRSPLASWLRVVTMRVAATLRGQDRPHADIDEALPASDLDPELAAIRRRHGASFRSALRDAAAELSPEERGVLRLHYLDGLNLERIGSLFRISRATAGRRILSARNHLLGRTRQIVGERLRATPSDIDSLLRIVRTQLASELAVVLREPAD